MAEAGYPVEWVDHQAIVSLPDRIDVLNAGLIAEELLVLINRGAETLIVDMTATGSCDFSGAEALVHAYKRAVANDAQLRLVVPAQLVRRVLSVAGVDRLVSVYPCRESALAAGMPIAQDAAAVGPAQISQDLLGRVVRNLFHAGLSLQAALDASHEADRQYILEAQQHLDEALRNIRDQVFVTGRPKILPSSEPPEGAH